MTSGRCSRNGCDAEATWSVCHRINGELYAVSLCGAHRDDIGDNV